MGNSLGTHYTRDINLAQDDKPTFDVQAGFSYQRQPRVMIAKEADLISAKIPPKNRDYCAHHLLDYQVCRYKKMPLVYRCEHEKHTYLNCEKDDYEHRMKEFERERRLRYREKRLVGSA